MKKKYYLYAGYYEWYITDKQLPRPFVLYGVFNSVKDAEKEAESNGDFILYDEDILEETEYYKQFDCGGCNIYEEQLEGESDAHVFSLTDLVA